MSVADLRTAPWLQREETQAILGVLDGAQRRTRAVGGAVRDTILGRVRDNPDVDLATELVPEEVIARAKAAGIAWYPTGIEHGTVTLRLGEVAAEVTTLRQDVVTDGRHAQVAFGTDWVLDASRRDFTLNALYCAADGTLYDPLGGVEDAVAGRVRFIGMPARRIAEDGLRVYRFFRFSASHGGQVFDPDGLSAVSDAVGRLDHISGERVGAEMIRMLALPEIARTVETMAAIRLLAVDREAIDGLVRYERLGGRSAMTRLALLGEQDPATVQKRWRLSNEIARQAETVAKAAQLIVAGRTGEAAYRYAEAAVEGLALAAARANWSRDLVAETARELAAVVVPSFPVSGRDITGLGILPGPVVGQTLALLERAWIDSGFALSKEALLARVEI